MILCTLTASSPLITEMTIQRPVFNFHLLILLAYENGDCPAVSVPQNGSYAQKAPNLLNQMKVCPFQPIEKLACGMPQ